MYLKKVEYHFSIRNLKAQLSLEADGNEKGCVFVLGFCFVFSCYLLYFYSFGIKKNVMSWPKIVRLVSLDLHFNSVHFPRIYCQFSGQ